MNFLKSFLPAPVVDLGFILLIVFGIYIAFKKGIEKLKESGQWDRFLEKLPGAEQLQLRRFEREIKRFEKAGDLAGAARLYEEAEWYPEAINMYIQAEDYVSAATLHEELEQWERAADMYFQAEDWKRAAQMLIKVGKHAEAAKHFEEHGQKIDAAKLYFDAAQYDKAAVLYEDVSYFPQAAKCFEKLGEHVKAAHNYEQQWSASTSAGGGGLIAGGSDREARVALHAGKLYEQGGAPERAAELYKRAGLSRQAAQLAAKEGRYLDAAELLLKEENLKGAAEMFEKAGQDERAALLQGEIAFHAGDNATAADHFLRGGDNPRAAELYESVGNLEGAARSYERGDAPLQAAGVYLRAGEKQKAAAMFEDGGDREQAANLYEEIKDYSKASELYEQSGRLFEAGKLAKQQGDGDRAIQLLQQIDGNHDHYEDATLVLARLFIEKKLPALAVDKLERLLGDQQISGKTLEHFYWLGRAFEELGKTAEAIDRFRKVLTERYGHEDVEQRIARLSAGSAAEPPTQGLPPAQPAAPAPPAPAAAAGQAEAASPIQLGELLGKGLLGTTHKGVDTRNQSPVIIKLLRQDLIQNKSILQQFIAEAKLARNLEHPSLVRLLGLIQVQGSKAAVTEYVEGFSLSTFLERNKRVSVKQGMDLLSTLAAAISYAHERKLLHRDLKLTNILIGAGGKIKITGFGMGALRVAQLGRADGYPAPEFLSGAAIGPRSDIYSLGAVIFHALTGSNPASEEACANGAPPLRQLCPDASTTFEQVLARCLSNDPGDRFASAQEVIAALQAATG